MQILHNFNISLLCRRNNIQTTPTILGGYEEGIKKSEVNKCDKRMGNEISPFLGNYDRPTDWSMYEQTDRFIGKYEK